MSCRSVFEAGPGGVRKFQLRDEYVGGCSSELTPFKLSLVCLKPTPDGRSPKRVPNLGERALIGQTSKR